MRQRAKSQPRLGKGEHRAPANTAFMQELIEDANREARRYGVSRSWVIAQNYARGVGLEWPKEFDYKQKIDRRRRATARRQQ